jgi:hypothetical protein
MPQKETAHQNGGQIPNVFAGNSEIVQRDDGLWAIGWSDDAPGPFDSRADAARIASGDKPEPAPVAKFRRINIREVRSNAPA